MHVVCYGPVSHRDPQAATIAHRREPPEKQDMPIQTCVAVCAVAALHAAVPIPSDADRGGFPLGPIDTATAGGTIQALTDDFFSNGVLTDIASFDFDQDASVQVGSGETLSIAIGDASASQSNGVARIEFFARNALGNVSLPESETSFSFTFTTVADAFFDFSASASAPFVNISFNGLVASRFPDPGAPQGIGGTMGAGGFFAAGGFLPAGEYTFSGNSGAGLLGSTPVPGDASATLTITEIPEPSTIAFTTLAAALSAGRRRRDR
jgi:hypothetical protein